MMNTSKSKFLSLILRHKPETIGIVLDSYGWAKTSEITAGMHITMEELEDIVRTDNKRRYSFNEDHTKIRANQGHSINVDVELKKAIPPAILYHGTDKRFSKSINANGLRPMSRLYVHLSSDEKTALNVGKRHGNNPIVYAINAYDMYLHGFTFYLSQNGVWLVNKVPKEYFIY